MKKSPQSMLGVTLLEIMLVLAIAAMVIVMSIRYYQSASNNQKITAGLNTVLGIVSAGESVLGAKGSFNSIATDALNYLPNGVVPNSPWGGAMSITSQANGTSYKINMSVPTNVCQAFSDLLKQNSKLTPACGNGSIDITVSQ